MVYDKNIRFSIPSLFAHNMEMPIRLFVNAIIGNQDTRFSLGKCLSITNWSFYKVGSSILIAEA